MKTFTVTPINDLESVKKDYTYWNSYITPETVPLIPMTKAVEVQVITYDKSITTKALIADLKEKGLQPASPNALLGFSQQYPDEQGWFVAASSVFRGEDGSLCFLRVDRDGSCRGLYMAYVEGEWDGDWGFLAEPLKLDSSEQDTVSLDTSSDLSIPEAQAIELLKSRGFKITRIKTIEKEY